MLLRVASKNFAREDAATTPRVRQAAGCTPDLRVRQLNFFYDTTRGRILPVFILSVEKLGYKPSTQAPWPGTAGAGGIPCLFRVPHNVRENLLTPACACFIRSGLHL